MKLPCAIQFGTAYGDMSGIYQCASYVCGDDCPNGFDEYYIMEGQRIGDYSCIESAVMYGLLGGGNSRAWNKVNQIMIGSQAFLMLINA